MTSGLESYLEALSNTKKLLDPPQGFSTYNATSKSDEVIINKIIQSFKCYSNYLINYNKLKIELNI